jgi:hypothetical protein
VLARKWLAPLCVLAAGCDLSGAFACTGSQMCVSGSSQGVCEATGFCSFSDPSCPSGSRYGQYAGAGLAGTCVGASDMREGGLPDGAPTDGGGADGNTTEGGPPPPDAAPDVLPSACGPGQPAACPAASSFQDNFSGANTGPGWTTNIVDCQVAQTNTGVIFTLAPNTTSSCAYITASQYDLRGSTALVNVASVPSPAMNVSANFRLVYQLDFSQQLFFHEEDGILYFLEATAQPQMLNNLGQVPYSVTTHAWWRFREALGMVYFETSQDGLAWTPQAMVSPLFSVATVSFVLGADEIGGVPTPGSARFAHYNEPP